MDTRVEAVQADREFWSRVLTAGGSTAVPRWVQEPVPGASEQETPVPDDVVTSVRALVRRSGLPLSALLLAAHAKVLAALSGEREIVTGYAAGVGGEPLPCRLTVPPGSWRALVSAAERAEAEVLEHREFPVAKLRRELGLTEPSYEVVFGAMGAEQDHADDGVLHVRWCDRGGLLTLRLRYRTDVLDAGSAERIGGYHLKAPRLLAADPDAEHAQQSLLSAEEVREQLEGLAGPPRALPDARAHELFERRVRAHPEAVAAVQGGREWTYGELNARANRLARALLARGLGREDVVAVVTERNLDWLAATLAVFKAGGAYLPIEPHFPAGRIAATLSRAGCRLVLTESGSTETLDQALATVPGAEKLLVETAYAEPHADDDLGVRVDPGQLAYIFFTSGSTGEPKGAMCEHAGMLNHLFAKIDDLGIGEGSVVAQTAPQCFDISLWQLVSALLVGGRTLLIGQDVVVDVERFVDTLVRGRVAVTQLVPSYLEVVVSYLEQRPRQLPDLRWVSVTGEALKRELAQRWFALQPGIRLLNAYGLTETSDDTNHEVLDGVPDRVLLGRAVNNVRVYVVDEQLALVPLGAPGLIAFSGVCVGRGYVNDPERTREAYRTDPYRPGERLYLGGDWGRWHPGGKLEFLGRRDSQVKIRGFRIEIGEIENTLLRVDGVRDGAVVVVERGGGNTQLIAFHSGRRHEPDVLREGPEGPDLRGRANRPRTRRGGRRGPGGAQPERAAAGGGLGRTAGRARAPDRPDGQLLRLGRHLPVGRQAQHRARPRGLPAGHHPAPRARRSGRPPRRRHSAAPGTAPAPVGGGRRPGVRAGLLPVRGRQRGELPADGGGAGGPRSGGPRGGPARSRPGGAPGAVRVDRGRRGSGRRRDHGTRPDQGHAVGPLVGRRTGPGDGQDAPGARCAGHTGVPRGAAARHRRGPRRRRRRADEPERRGDRGAAHRRQRLHRTRRAERAARRAHRCRLPARLRVRPPLLPGGPPSPAAGEAGRASWPTGATTSSAPARPRPRTPS